MKSFYSILEGINYIKCCSFCKENLILNTGNISIKINKESQCLNYTYGNSQLEIDLISDKFLNFTQNHFYANVYGIGSTISQTYIGSSYCLPITGWHTFHLKMYCCKCMKYSFTLQVILSMDINAVVDVSLHSEYFSIRENDNKFFEIKNIYSVPETIYTEYNFLNSSKEIVLPLISFNHENPQESLDRIKNLIVFS